ncbi:PREDICTED: uncharacterized protein LOC100635302 [Amphimedon queenslandica]|uniref:Adipose-secreted signaling protein n=1 Tax=Amphimedon queenslandica TaxID=400682 RepID=A0A1X7VCZ9_AMPQE|nr:PREDICTED: uncharacterized protein LOC100635302 [Amphimedon queenslandica]|eukprot:XP_003384682.1 PREDICTED: uncharacterized protein LOC100635302 [Amphimedon queenslandica]
MSTNSHVRFAEGTHLDPDKLHVTDDGSQYHLPEAHIGFLRNHHTYHADVPIKHGLGSDVTVTVPNYNLYVRINEVQPTTASEDGEYVTPVQLEVKTIKEGRIREKVLVHSGTDDSKSMEILITAQVMEANQGNPLLKDGVHVVSHEVEDESEWPGHSSH